MGSSLLLLQVVSISITLSFAASVITAHDDHHHDAASCPVPLITNGRVYEKRHGKAQMLKVFCSPAFTILGNELLTCVDGSWDAPIPDCAKPGCRPFPPNASRTIDYGKMSATAFCQPGYQLVGPRKTICNGTNWNLLIGGCRPSSGPISTRCDFEAEDLCGWTNEMGSALNWTRSAGMKSRGELVSGPESDHTSGTPLHGHFLKVDSRQRFTQTTARLFSPVYPANYSSDTCFQFFYHMLGQYIGKLVIYVKPLSTSLKETIDNEGHHFGISGDQGNVWQEGYFDVPLQNESFQFVIEATLGLRFHSDIAIDDLAMLHGNHCKGMEGEERFSNEAQIFLLDSCKNRCGWIDLDASKGDTLESPSCSCVDSCLENATCCSDYVETCLMPLFSNNIYETVTSRDNATELTTQKISLTTSKSPRHKKIPPKPNNAKSNLLWFGAVLLALVIVTILWRVRHKSRALIYFWSKKTIVC
ncbi:MAM and LDL-receptor class A domain-containing protein 1-like [Uranotaenia lowii]|uniref:MAM and LDL-receptor class A domain-containing protein 1-like n=1 Tax=Uranotaenia lowii TaxID=190385 RepID=UPI002479EFA7|nr:MAM and LDL-receptor class A domain-containing protein 1-like [Uranotaenia lowii]